jgi:nicotinamidase-related amidase
MTKIDPATPHTGDTVVANSLRLREAFRAAVVTKFTIGGFAGTDLDELLRGKGVRAASDHGYDTVAVSDAMTALSDTSHENAITKIFPRLGTVVTTDEALAGLA